MKKQIKKQIKDIEDASTDVQKHKNNLVDSTKKLNIPEENKQQMINTIEEKVQEYCQVVEDILKIIKEK